MFPLGPIAGELYDNGRKIVLLRDFVFEYEGYYVLVPKWQTSDFNSTPRFLWTIFPPWHHPEAGVVHDYLYRNGIGTREDADKIHRDILKVTGASRFLRNVVYRSLRLFGRGAWKEIK